MDRVEFNDLIREANLTKKEFADFFNLSVATINGWGSNRNHIPYWVESWLKNYIELQRCKQALGDCVDKNRELNNQVYELMGEPIGIDANTTTASIALATDINRIAGERIITDATKYKQDELKKMLIDAISPLSDTISSQSKDFKQIKNEIKTIKEALKSISIKIKK